MGLFRNIFSSDKLAHISDFSTIGVDVHSHLVPAIDDGVQSMEESIEVIKELKNNGYTKLFTTPHIMVDPYNNTRDIIESGCDALRQELKKQEIAIEIKAAAEYHVDYLLLKKEEHSNLLTFNDKHLLFELSYFNPPPDLETLLFELQIKGYKLILAHPERYIYYHNKFSDYENLRNRNIYFQLNINSLSGFYTKPVKKVAEKLLKEGMIDFLGTDSHSIDHATALQLALKNKALLDFIESGKVKNKILW